MSALALPCNPFLGEPVDAIKHVRWCERGGCKVAPYSILVVFRGDPQGYQAAYDAGAGESGQWSGGAAN
jgi:hypothetical protein